MLTKNLQNIVIFLTGISVVFLLIYLHNSVALKKAHADTTSFSLYEDSLASGFANWSWNSTIDFQNANAYQGSKAIAFTPNGGYAGLYLHTDNAIDTTPYIAITFAAKASSQNEAFSFGIYDTNNQLTQTPVSLDNYGGQPTPDGWKVYTIPLTDLKANNTHVKGFTFIEITGKAQPAVYVDSIALTGFATTNSSQPTPTISLTPATTNPSPTPLAQIATQTNDNPLASQPFYLDAATDPAASQEQQWKDNRPQDAAALDKIASQAKAIWLGNWNGNVQSDVQKVVDQADAAKKLPVFVAYNIPNRDCGSYSAGGSASLTDYQNWISQIANGIGTRKAAVVLEPDALAQISCLPAEGQTARYQMLSSAVATLKSLGNTAVYIDAGHAGWIDPTEMANRLKNAGIAKADGFSLNVSNFDTDADSIAYGHQISNQIGNKHFVIDTSRNGNGPTSDNQWCNPDGRALGDKPTTQTNNALVDAFLWIKYPGESDGACNGAPSAGTWNPTYALGLAQRAKW